MRYEHFACKDLAVQTQPWRLAYLYFKTYSAVFEKEERIFKKHPYVILFP